MDAGPLTCARVVLVACVMVLSVLHPASVPRAAVSISDPPGVEQDGRDPSAGTVIRGRVVAGDTGVPIPDAAVSIVPLRAGEVGVSGAIMTGRSARGVPVDGAGRFEIAGLAAGYYRLVASPGTTSAQYLTGRFPEPRSDDPAVLMVADKQLITGVEIRLPRAAAITGRVVDERGGPIAHVSVSVRSLLPGNRLGGERHLTIIPVMTDDMGSFRLFGVAPGDYLVHARPMVRGHLTMTFQNAESVTRYGRSFAPAYYPGSPSAANAVPIRVDPGETYGPIELTVAEARVFAIRGMLFGSTGEAVTNAPVYLRRAEAAPGTVDLHCPGAMPALDDGTFQIHGVAPGNYYVGATRALGDLREIGWTPVQVFDDVEGVVVRLQPGTTLRGQVLFEGRVPPALFGLQVRSVPVAPMPVDAITARPDANGVFELPHQLGPTLIRIEGLRGWHLKSVLYGGQDITDRPMVFEERGPAARVVLTDRAAALSGVVRTRRGSPVDAVVLLVSDDPALFHEHSTTTKRVQSGGDGVYRLEGLRAGRYLAIALDPDEPSLTGFTREYFDLVVGHGVSVVLHDGDTATLNLTLTDLR